MSFLFDFGFSQEDELVASAALDAGGQTVLCVASAGDVPLSLLALGARQIIAVDISEPQLHLCRLKAAAIQCLAREAAAGLLESGAAWATSPEEVAAQSDTVITCLPSPGAVRVGPVSFSASVTMVLSFSKMNSLPPLPTRS